jgi:hypothetical protein
MGHRRAMMLAALSTALVVTPVSRRRWNEIHPSDARRSPRSGSRRSIRQCAYVVLDHSWVSITSQTRSVISFEMDRAMLSSDSFRLYSDRQLSIHYAPFDRVNIRASLAVVGITHVWTQMELAYRTARQGLLEARAREVILVSVKRTASFAGSMRSNLVTMLDALGLLRVVRTFTGCYRRAAPSSTCASAASNPKTASTIHWKSAGNEEAVRPRRSPSATGESCSPGTSHRRADCGSSERLAEGPTVPCVRKRVASVLVAACATLGASACGRSRLRSRPPLRRRGRVRRDPASICRRTREVVERGQFR